MRLARGCLALLLAAAALGSLGCGQRRVTGDGATEGFAVCGDGKVDPGEACDDGLANGNVADACRPTCVWPRCGDGVVDSGEGCDAGALNSAAPDACRPDCTPARCGDGTLDTGEQCDQGPGNSDTLPGACRSTCRQSRCGDGVLDPGESCDAGPDNSDTAPDACRTTCVAARCGDGVLDSGEGCDAGSLNSATEADACRLDCSPARCGDGTIDRGETCDSGPGNSDIVPGACRTSCRSATCGDGVLDPGEACDAGQANSDTLPDACRTTCHAPGCGDGVVDTGEACDQGPGNSSTAPDACRPSCLAAACGDGVVDTGEACDDGLGNSDLDPDVCRSTCQAPRCGDGVRDSGEACDRGPLNSNLAPDACRTSCALPRCGDGVADAGEACDAGEDNSDLAADACRTHCELPRCGDGVVDSGEGCDAGAANSDTAPDACRTSCVEATCGDGVVDTGEACDAGAASSDTAPDACRTSCVAARCGDGVVDKGEACDAGAANSDTTPDACRTSCVAAACGDGVVDKGEACDAGAGNSDTAPDACRTSCVAAACGDGVVDTGEECDGALADVTRECDACKVAKCPELIDLGTVEGSVRYEGSTLGQRNDQHSSCARSLDNEDVLVGITLKTRSRLEVVVEGRTVFAPILEARDGCLTGAKVLACDHDDGILDDSRILLEDVPAGNIYLVVDQQGARPGGPFTLTLNQQEIRAKGSSCAAGQRCAAGLACVGNSCVDESCGDGVTTGREECDDGNATSGDGCTSDCQFEGEVPGLEELDLKPDDQTHVVQFSSTTVGAEDDWFSTCQFQGPWVGASNGDRAFSFVAPISARWTAVLSPSFPGAVLSTGRMSDWPWNSGCDGGSPPTLTFDVDEGDTGHVAVSGFSLVPGQSEGSFTLTLTPVPLKDEGDDCDPAGVSSLCRGTLACAKGSCAQPSCGDGIVSAGEDCDDGNAVDGDGCESTCARTGASCTQTAALSLDAGGGFSVHGDSAGRASALDSSCAVYLTGQDVIYELTAPFAGRWDLEVDADFDVVFSIRSTCGDVATELACADAAIKGSEQASVELARNQVVYLVVDSTPMNAPGGSFTLTGVARPSEAAGDTCDPDGLTDVCQNPLVCSGTCGDSRCGDGITAGAEECDDGNDLPGDGCSSCKREGKNCDDALDVRAVDTDPDPDRIVVESTVDGMGNDVWVPCALGAASYQNAEDVTYSLTAGDTGEVWEFELTPLAKNVMGLSVASQCGDDNGLLACARSETGYDAQRSVMEAEPARFQLASGQTAYLQVDSYADTYRAWGKTYRLEGRRLPAASEGDPCDDSVVCIHSSCVLGTCKAAVCGNGTAEYGETCDDGNLDDHDGCDSTCRVEGDTCDNAPDLASVDQNPDPDWWEIHLDVDELGDDLITDCSGWYRSPDAVFTFTAPQDGYYYSNANFASECPPALTGSCNNGGSARQLSAGEKVFLVYEVQWTTGSSLTLPNVPLDIYVSR